MAPSRDQGAGAPPGLSRTAILDRALAVADAEGLEAVGVRRLARDLGVTPMALYWHFADKQALLHALGDRLLAGLDVAVDEGLPWAEQLRVWLASFVAVLRTHPSAAVLVGSLPTAASERAQAATEVFLRTLAGAGFSAEEAAYVARQVVRALTAIAAAEFRPDAAEESAEALAAAAGGRFPHVAAAAGPLTAREDPDAFYDLTVELILGGVQAVAARRRPGAG